MLDKEFGVITFKSTNYAIGAEAAFKTTNLKFRMIPTPREISHSCGLAIKFSLEDLEEVKSTIKENNLNIDSIFKIVKGKDKTFAEKINGG